MSEESQILPEALPLGPDVRLIEANKDGLVALDKPSGVMSHPNRHEERHRALLDAHYDYEREEFSWENDAGDICRAWLVNRLDSPTSGVILIALNKEVADAVKQSFAAHRVNKTYYALVKRTPGVPAGVWSDVLSKTIVRGGRKIKDAQRLPAKSRYQVVKDTVGGFPVCLLKLMPVTGRTHQLRIQCKSHNHPIVGDQTYGSFSFNREVAAETGVKRLLLHSAETTVNYAYQGKSQHFTAKSALPAEFDAVLKFRPGLNTGRGTRAPMPHSSSRALSGRRFRRP
ncbi:RluA family pseudouridine synthase [Coraliomargarita parva]|uniref:RluA family pseudouridine synthase n=1 Tax=Coraliomargarita parva TaxID=3014050 RepID=UPI0022B2B55B|nr:RNA pseudouridine synthase [Coraliomargarita parva]